MPYYKRYFNEPEPLKITKKGLRHWLKMAFDDVEAVIAVIDEGHFVQTRFALYANTPEAIALPEPKACAVSGRDEPAPPQKDTTQ
jgi:hypothetical protein